MTQYETKAAEVLAILKDHARDMEADLGKAARSRVDNPEFGHVQPLASPGAIGAGIANQRIQMEARIAAEYGALVTGAHEIGQPVTGADLAARDSVRSFVAQIQSVTTYEAARTLVSSIA